MLAINMKHYLCCLHRLPGSQFAGKVGWFLLFFIGFFNFIDPARSQHVAQLTTELQIELNRIAEQDVPEGAPGIATGIVLDGRLIYTKCAGLEDISSKMAITQRSRFNIASTGKQFTALAIIQLEADGKLSCKDDIRKYFPKLYKGVQSPLTIEHLLTHTSGIGDIHHLWSLQGVTWWKNEFENADAMELLARQEDLNFVPGSGYLYSNSNYIILAELVTKVSGYSFVDFTNEMFLQLGMPDTSFEANHSAIRGPVAKPYFNFETWTTYDWLPDLVGDGNLFSTLKDQLQWELLIQGHGETDFDRALIEKSQKLVNPRLSQQYGFGLEHRDNSGLKTIYHEGATGAWKAFALRFPDRKLSIVTVSNSGKANPALQTYQMVELLIDVDNGDANGAQMQPQAMDSRVEIDEILGTYLSDGGSFFEFIRSADQLLLRRDGRKDVLLERESANAFYEVGDPEFKLEFKTVEHGEMQVTAYHDSHSPYSLNRVNDDWQGLDFELLNGTFVNAETGSKLQLVHVGERRYTFEIEGKNAREARLLSRNRLASGGYLIHWAGDLAHNTTLLLNTDRLRDVKFIRLPSAGRNLFDQDARKAMSRRTSLQQTFLIEYIQSNPPIGTSKVARMRWMDNAQEAFADSFRDRELPGTFRGSRIESFSPYVWSWLPMLVTNGSPGEDLLNATQVARVYPAVLADLEAIVSESEPGVCELLRVPDLGNGLARAELLAQFNLDFLERFRAACEELPTTFSNWKVSLAGQGLAIPRHLVSAGFQLQTFASLIDVELDIRARRLEMAQSRIASMAVPGQLPSGFRAMVTRLAQLYHLDGRDNSALAVLDLGLLSTTEADWPSTDLRTLYQKFGGPSGVARFELVVPRRALPLVPSTVRFDLKSLVDIESGQALELRDFAGKTLVLDFMTYGCQPCLESVPVLQNFDDEHEEIVVISVVVGESEDRLKVVRAIRDRGGKFTMTHDTGNWAERLKVVGYPSYVVVSPDRTVLKPFGLRTEPTHSLDDVIQTLVFKKQ